MILYITLNLAKMAYHNYGEYITKFYQDYNYIDTSNDGILTRTYYFPLSFPDYGGEKAAIIPINSNGDLVDGTIYSYLNGNLYYSCQIKNGYEHGLKCFYYYLSSDPPNYIGKIHFEYNFTNGKLMSCLTYHQPDKKPVLVPGEEVTWLHPRFDI